MQQTEGMDVVSFDCAGAGLKTCINLDVVSFPAVRLYHSDGRVDRYRGARRAAGVRRTTGSCTRATWA